MPSGENAFRQTEVVGSYERRCAEALERIASALEEANRLNAPAAEINAFNLKQLRAATEGGVIAAPGQILRK